MSISGKSCKSGQNTILFEVDTPTTASSIPFSASTTPNTGDPWIQGKYVAMITSKLVGHTREIINAMREM